MSNDVFPVLPGLKWGTNKQPIWATKVLTAASGRETRGSFQSYPRWKFTLSYEFLRAGGGFSELQQLVGFFNQRMGSFDSFLYRDPNDYQVVNQALGTGDGTRVEYRLVRNLGGFVEPVLAPDDVWLYLDAGGAGRWRLSNAARTNGLPRSEDTAAGWTRVGLGTTPNTAADPSGASTFDLVQEDTSNGTHEIYRALVPPGGADVKHCVSWHVVPAGRPVVSVRALWPGVAGGAVFDLTGGGSVVLTDSTVLSAGVRALAGGIYRVWIVCRPTSAASNSVRLQLRGPGNASSYAGDGSSGAHIGWAQVEALPDDAPEEPTHYIPSTGASATTVPADFTLGDLGYFTFATAPAAGQDVSWSGTFYFRCRFTHDALDIEEFLRDLYSGKKVEFISEK